METNRLNFKHIFICVIAFLTIAAGMGIGIVFAISKDSFNVGSGATGEVGFKATEIYADITGRVTGVENAPQFSPIQYRYNTLETDVQTAAESWKNFKLELKAGTQVQVVIEIENKADDRTFWVSFKDSISINNTRIVRYVDETEISIFDEIEIPVLTKKTFKTSISVADRNRYIDGEFKLQVNLTTEKPSVSHEATQNIRLSSREVVANLSAEISGTKTQKSLQGVSIAKNTTKAQLSTAAESWRNVGIDFNEANSSVTTTINVTNNGLYRLYLSISENITLSNVTISRTIAGKSVEKLSNIEVEKIKLRHLP